MLHRIALAAVLACATLTAQAQLFSDDEARRAILDLRTRVGTLDEQLKQQAATIAQLQRSLLELNNQNQQLKQDLAQLRGQNEQSLQQVSDLQRRQKDLASGVDQRLGKLEPQTITLDGQTFTADAEVVRLYDEALAPLKAGQFDQAATLLAAFVKRYPASGYQPSARYWLGNAQFGAKKTRDALATFKGFAEAYPDHLRAPEAYLAMANSQIELKDTRGARKTLGDLIKAYPKTEAAVAARERLATLK